MRCEDRRKGRTMQRRRWLFMLPPLIEFVADIVVTLQGQPAVYWEGETSSALEANPVGLYLLGWHPGAFIACAVVYALVFSIAIAWLPEFWAFWISLGLLIAHTSGTNSWLLTQCAWCEGAHNAFAAVVAATCYRAYFVQRSTGKAANDLPEREGS